MVFIDADAARTQAQSSQTTNDGGYLEQIRRVAASSISKAVSCGEMRTVLHRHNLPDRANRHHLEVVVRELRASGYDARVRRNPFGRVILALELKISWGKPQARGPFPRTENTK